MTLRKAKSSRSGKEPTTNHVKGWMASCPKTQTEPQARILEAFSKPAETSTLCAYDDETPGLVEIRL